MAIDYVPNGNGGTRPVVRRDVPKIDVAKHDFDEDGCCIHCNFDGAEWSHWKRSTYEGRAQPDARQPSCNRTWSAYRA